MTCVRVLTHNMCKKWLLPTIFLEGISPPQNLSLFVILPPYKWWCGNKITYFNWRVVSKDQGRTCGAVEDQGWTCGVVEGSFLC